MHEIFTTTQYRVLEIIHKTTIAIGSEKYCPLGQNEIAEIMSCNRMTANKAIKDLKEYGYISVQGRTKKYCLTEMGKLVIERTKDL